MSKVGGWMSKVGGWMCEVGRECDLSKGILKRAKYLGNVRLVNE